MDSEVVSPPQLPSSPPQTVILSWNIEGFRKGLPTLLFYIKKHSPSLLFLSEPQIYNCDLSAVISDIGPYKILLKTNMILIYLSTL